MYNEVLKKGWDQVVEGFKSKQDSVFYPRGSREPLEFIEQWRDRVTFELKENHWQQCGGEAGVERNLRQGGHLGGKG